MGRIQSYNSYTVLTGAAAYPELTVSNSVVNLSALISALSENPNAATLVCVGNPSDTNPVPLVYYTLNGEDPSGSSGMPLYNGGVLEIFEGELSNARFIRATSNDQTLKIEFANVG
jgi:hypothetical protein